MTQIGQIMQCQDCSACNTNTCYSNSTEAGVLAAIGILFTFRTELQLMSSSQCS